MIYNLLLPYINQYHIANLIHYISFRSGIALVLSLLISFTIGKSLIFKLRGWQKKGQPIRNDIPVSHQLKAGTPTMGGLMVIISMSISSLLLTDLTNIYVWVTLFTTIGFGFVGFMDDYAKVTKNCHKGISGKKRLLIQSCISIIACYLIHLYAGSEHSSHLSIPFFKNLLINFGYFYIPFVIFVTVGAGNAVNLTDGLDGLAIGLIALSAASLGLISYLVGNTLYSEYLQIIHVPDTGELTIMCAALIGSCLGFLWFNAAPAEIFMGDVGSLSLGAMLGIVSVITKQEIVLAIIGGVFVLETLSVIIQVYYFKATKGKRLFLMAPLHHHFEKLGWLESKIVIRFWILGIIFALIGLSSLKLR